MLTLYKYSQPSVIRNSFIRKPCYPDRMHACTVLITISKYPETRYPKEISKVPKVLDNGGLTVMLLLCTGKWSFWIFQWKDWRGESASSWMYKVVMQYKPLFPLCIVCTFLSHIKEYQDTWLGYLCKNIGQRSIFAQGAHQDFYLRQHGQNPLKHVSHPPLPCYSTIFQLLEWLEVTSGRAMDRIMTSG